MSECCKSNQPCAAEPRDRFYASFQVGYAMKYKISGKTSGCVRTKNGVEVNETEALGRTLQARVSHGITVSHKRGQRKSHVLSPALDPTRERHDKTRQSLMHHAAFAPLASIHGSQIGGASIVDTVNTVLSQESSPCRVSLLALPRVLPPPSSFIIAVPGRLPLLDQWCQVRS